MKKKKLLLKSFFFAAEGEPTEVIAQFMQKLTEAFAQQEAFPKQKPRKKNRKMGEAS